MKQVEGGQPVPETCRELAISQNDTLAVCLSGVNDGKVGAGGTAKNG
jgi:hypothetical protein